MRRPSRNSFSNLRARACALCLACVLALACAGAPAALGAGTTSGNALSELTKEEPTSTAKTATTSTATTSSETKTSEPSNSSRTILIATVFAIVLLSGIAFVIVRDARRVAPAGDTDLVEERDSRDTAVMMRRRRAKAKAARQQRKRNR